MTVYNCDENKSSCWYGRDDILKERIEKSRFVKEARKKLARKKLNKLNLL